MPSDKGRFFIKTPKKINVSFSNYTYRENFKRLVVLVIVALIIILSTIGVLLWTDNDVDITGHIAIMTYSLLSLIIAKFIISRNYEKYPLITKIFLYASIQIILILSINLSLPTGGTYKLMTPYIITILVISVNYFIEPDISFWMYLITCIIFIVVLPRDLYDSSTIITESSNIIIITSIAWILSRQIYHYRLQLFWDSYLLKEKNALLEQMVVRDSMTNLYNHKKSYEILNENILNSESSHDSFSLILLDIDHFKKVNDNYGHRFGDVVIIRIGELIKSNLRETDSLGRYGGEEYIITLPKTRLVLAAEIAERIRATIENEIFDLNVKITISGGVAEYNGESGDQLVEKVDSNLYVAKNNGRNKIVY